CPTAGWIPATWRSASAGCSAPSNALEPGGSGLPVTRASRSTTEAAGPVRRLRGGRGGEAGGLCQGGGRGCDVGLGGPAAQRQADRAQRAARVQAHRRRDRGRGVGAAVAGRAGGGRDGRGGGQEGVSRYAIDAEVQSVRQAVVGGAVEVDAAGQGGGQAVVQVVA